MTVRTLVFGASGKFAGSVVPALATRGVTVRAFVRDDAGAETARTQGASDIAMGDLNDATSVRRALKGIERVFYIAPAFIEGEAEIGKAVVAACVESGVQRFVFSSVIHPVIASLSNHAGKAPVEEAVLGSHLEYTFLHPALFFQNYSDNFHQVAETGVLAEPWSCETRFSRVDYRDVAEVAAIALTEDRLCYGTFELCSDGWLNRHDVARMIGQALGREIKAAKLDPGKTGDQAQRMRPMFEHYDHVGLRGNPLTLRAILGHEPCTLEAFFRELAGRR